mgnify:CR=1 FL=1
MTGASSTSGKVITFDGFYRAYVASSDDPSVEQDDKENILPKLHVGERLGVEALEPTSHTTQPPARYTEASLVKELEARGIGRPSTYASIIQTIQDRGYVWHKGQALVPTFTAFAVIRLLERPVGGGDVVGVDIRQEIIGVVENSLYEGPRQGGALLLTARHLPRVMVGALFQADDFQRLRRGGAFFRHEAPHPRLGRGDR